jgi:hypothetical protein
MPEEIKQNPISGETKPAETEIQEKENTVLKSENQNWLKHRLEREREKATKQILNELGAESTEYAKEKLESIANYQKQISDLQNQIKLAKELEFKVEVLRGGIDEKFVDFVVHELKSKVSETEKFSDIFENFKNENPHYLKQSGNKGIKFSTSSNFEKKIEKKNISQEFNEAILRKLQKE